MNSHGASFPEHGGKFLFVLLVEGDENLRRSIERYLVAQGHFVMSAATFAAGCEMGRENEFDLLVCDMDLHDGSGLELMSELQKFRPLLGIAMGASMSEYARSLSSGFAAHLVKPFDMSELGRKIASISVSEL